MLRLLSRPFNAEMVYFFYLLMLQLIQVYASHKVLGSSGIGLSIASIGIAWLLTLPASLLHKHKWIKNTYLFIVLISSSIIGLFELFCAMVFDELLYGTYFVIAAATNISEAHDFITTFVHFDFIFSLLCFLILFACIKIIHYKFTRFIPYPWSLIPLPLAIFSVLFTFTFHLWNDIGFGRGINALRTAINYADYNLVTSQAKISTHATRDIHPTNIILIMGESYDRLHAEIYGYDHPTTPHLKQLADSGKLIIFRNVLSASTSTSESFRQMFTSSDQFGDPNWSCKAMLPTALRKSGYYTMWLSNQNPISVFDNVLGELGSLCDSTNYIMPSFINSGAHMDELLLQPFINYRDSIAPKHSNNFCMIHLLGSHTAYSKRYPIEYEHFHASDYPELPPHQRQTISEYDNSILYNDFVVSRLIEESDSLNAIIIYTSDHGQDLYYTRPNVATHGNLSNPESTLAGSRVPFIIYLTSQFREEHPQYEEFLHQFVDKPFNNRHLFNTILDIAGYDIDHNPITDKSFFTSN